MKPQSITVLSKPMILVNLMINIGIIGCIVGASLSLISILILKGLIKLFLLFSFGSLAISLTGVILYSFLKNKVIVEIEDCFLVINSDGGIKSARDINYLHNYLIDGQKNVYHIDNSNAFSLNKLIALHV